MFLIIYYYYFLTLFIYSLDFYSGVCLFVLLVNYANKIREKSMKMKGKMNNIRFDKKNKVS